MNEYEKQYKGFYDGITIKIYFNHIDLFINKYDTKPFGSVSYNQIIYNTETLIVFLFDYNEYKIAAFNQVKFLIDMRE